MCLGVPGGWSRSTGRRTVDFWACAEQVRLDIVDEPVAPGDYVLNHVGFAIRRIPAEEIGETLALYDELLADGRAGRPDGAPTCAARSPPPERPAEAADDARCAATARQLEFRDPGARAALAAALRAHRRPRSGARRCR